MAFVAGMKVDICEQRTEEMGYATVSSVLKNAETALSVVKARKPDDPSILALALLTLARVQLLARAFMGAFVSAKAAARAYRKAGNHTGRAAALLTWASADLALEYFQEARSTAEAAFAIYDEP